MTDFFLSLLPSLQLAALWFAGLFIGFGLLAKLFPCHPGQKLVRPGMLADLCYWFFMPLLTRWVRLGLMGLMVALVLGGAGDAATGRFLMEGRGPLSRWPLWVQMAAILILSDIYMYWMHRLFHTGKWWHFHAVHHSPRVIDWLSGVRFHPVNFWLSFTLLDVLLLACGFSPAALAALAPFNILFSSFVHANLDCTLGPLKYVIATPVFHRWHHVARGAGVNKNFAPTFPALDLMFGTFYMPKGEIPQEYGISGDPVPEDFPGQIAYPFRKL